MAREGDYDFIFVDGGHSLESVVPELSHLLRLRPLCVMAHDTTAMEAGYKASEFEGSHRLAQTFMYAPGYQYLEDYKDREGELTHRGLFFATTDRGLYDIAEGIFKKWS